jgi:hypothetical protein
MNLRPAPSILSLLIALGVCAALPSTDIQNSNPSEWTGRQVYEILNNSAWSKTLKMNFYASSNTLGSQNTGNVNTARQTPMAGGMGRRGMGGSSSRTYSSGSSAPPSAPAKSGPTEVTIQWQSALVVRMAAAKKNGETPDPASLKPLDRYVIAVIGMPITAVGGRAASADSDNTQTADEEQRIAEHVRTSASLLRSGHEPLAPTKVDLDQGKDGRTLIYFPKSDPIKASDKGVEFRLVLNRGEIRKKFALKEMEYEGKLDL